MNKRLWIYESHVSELRIKTWIWKRSSQQWRLRKQYGICISVNFATSIYITKESYKNNHLFQLHWTLKSNFYLKSLIHFFNPARNIHRYNIRLFSRMTYVILKARKKLWNLQHKLSGDKVWNDVSDDIKLLSLRRFRKKFKSILIAKY